jgi:Uri superfamily endonuclease
VLVLALDRDATLRIGRLGVVSLRAGFYAYVGSALGSGGIAARVGRHARGSTALHWHIDYLRRCASIREAWFATGRARPEHHWARALARMPRSMPTLAGFGSSDCRCASHLVYFDVSPTLDAFRRALRGSEAARGTSRRPRAQNDAALEKATFT